MPCAAPSKTPLLKSSCTARPRAQRLLSRPGDSGRWDDPRHGPCLAPARRPPSLSAPRGPHPRWVGPGAALAARTSTGWAELGGTEAGPRAALEWQPRRSEPPTASMGPALLLGLLLSRAGNSARGAGRAGQGGTTPSLSRRAGSGIARTLVPPRGGRGLQGRRRGHGGWG